MSQIVSPFQLPTKAHTYVEDIVTRCHDLIDRQIWQGLRISDLRRWMANFITDEERYFAACILDSLIYRSEDQTIALIKQLYQRVLPDLSRQTNAPVVSSENWQDLLSRNAAVDPHIRLIPVRKREDSPFVFLNACPRCDKNFYSSFWGGANAFRSTCSHCGLTWKGTRKGVGSLF